MHKQKNCVLARFIGFLLLFILSSFSNPITTRDCVKQRYESQIGVKELTGHNDGVQVEKYQKSVGIPKGAPYCAAFVNWCLQECGADHKGSGWSPAWFDVQHVIYKKGSTNKITPRQGDVFGIWFRDLNRIAHVGFIDTWNDDDYVITVEGNTNASGSREGQGVMRKRRLKEQIYIVADYIR